MEALHIVLLLTATLSCGHADDYAIHYVSADGGEDCPSDQVCHNLSYYFSDPDLFFSSNTTFRFLGGMHLLHKMEPIKVVNVNSLELSGNGEWITGLEETVMESTAIIYCVKGSGGFTFLDSSRITINGLSLINCGAYNHCPDVKLLSDGFNATFLFVSIMQLTLSHVSIQNSSGHGLVAYNCRSIDIKSCSIAYSNIDQKSVSWAQRNSPTGSNAFFGYLMPKSTTQLNILHSNFTDGCDYYGNLVIHALGSGSVRVMSYLHSVVVFQRIPNGGDGIVIRSNMSRVVFNYDNSIVRGTNGSGRGISIKEISSQPIICIILNRVQLIDNSGGELFFESYKGTLQLYVSDTVFLHRKEPKQGQCGVCVSTRGTDIMEITFQNIRMSLANAFTDEMILKTSGNTFPYEVRIQDSTFDGNSDTQSVLRLAVDTKAYVVNCIFLNYGSGDSVISVLVRRELIIENVTIANNNMTAISVWSGQVYFNGSNIIANNRNKHGAGVYIQGSSYITVLNDSELIFLNNTAETVGGAIEVADKRPFSDDYCSILFFNTSRVVFSGNRAVEGGSDIYGARLVDCIDVDHNRVPRQGQPNETAWYFNTPYINHNMQFSNIERHSSLSSDPIMVCFCNENGLPDCSERLHHHHKLFPGEVAITEIATVGNYGGTSSGTIALDVHNAQLVRPYDLQATTARCLKLHLLLNSTYPTAAYVNITVNGGLKEWGVTLFVDIMGCPPGFRKDKQSGKCICAALLEEFNISCLAAHNTSSFRRSGTNWFAFINSSRTCLTVFTNCPFDYCNSSLVTFNILNPDNQCTGSRTGVLCGQCQPELSLLLGSNRCAPCSNVYLLLVPAFALTGIALVGVLMALNLTVSSGTVNSLLLYANMVKLNENVFFPTSRPPVVSQFISWLNLDFGIEVCLFDGLDGYWKTWLQFAFPAYLFILMGGIIIGSEYSVRICRLCGSHAVPALATLFLMSYTKILQTVTNALSVSQLDCNGTLLKVWSVDGNIDYFSGKHLILVIFSSCVLGVGVVYPLLVLFAPLLERYSGKCIPYKWNPVLKLKPLLDAYGGPYRDSHRYWTGVTLLVRLVVTILFSFTSGRLAFLNSIIISTTVHAFFFVWLFTRGVYRNLMLNILNSLFLLNLFVLAVSSLAFTYLNLVDAQEIATTVSTLICLLGLGFIAVGHILSKVKQKWLRRKSQSFNFLQSSRDRRSNSSNSLPPGSPPSHVYGSIRGQHQFDLYFPNNDSFSSSDMKSPSSPVLREREPLLFSTTTPRT